MPLGRRWPAMDAGRLARRLLTPELLERAARVRTDQGSWGFDRFGLHRDWVALGLGVTRPLYERWFRVRSSGHEHIPASGPAILACNHSGSLPFDALMLWADVVRRAEPPRVPRAVVDYFVNVLPFVSILFSRAGAVGGSRGNVHQLLRDGELVMLFPEGTPGISKPFRDRYVLSEWRPGHVEMAIRHRAPVVPVGLVGAEEQLPQLGRLDLHPFGAPYLPIFATLLPLPVRYHIRYGPPLALHEGLVPDDADDPAVVRAGAQRVKAAVEALVAQGLQERTGVFA